MSDSDTALEHLKMIRSLMERATVYRAVSLPTALMSGAVAIFTALGLFFADESASTTQVMGVWLACFVVVNLFHHGLIWRTARQEGDPYLSSGLRMAMKALLPPMFAGGLIGAVLGFGPRADIVGAALIWALCYGLALLATNGFSPRSLRLLGLAFTLTGTLLLGWHWLSDSLATSPQRLSAIVMGGTFGLYHLIYACCVRLGQKGSARETNSHFLLSE